MNTEQYRTLTPEQQAAVMRAEARMRQAQQDALTRAEAGTRQGPGQPGATGNAPAQAPQNLTTEQRRRRLQLLQEQARIRAAQGSGLDQETRRLLEAARATELLQQHGDQADPAQKGWGQTFRENIFGDDAPDTQNFGERVGSALNKAGEAMTFGLVGDETSAAVESLVPGVNYDDRRDHYRQQEEVLERDNPGLALGADIGGSVAGAVLPLGAAGTLSRGASLMPRVGASVAAGGAGGATYGFMEGEGLSDRTTDAQTGAKFGAAAGLAAVPVGAAVQRAGDAIVGRRAMANAARNAPSSEELRAMGQAAYRQIDDAGVQIKPEAFERNRQRIVDVLRRGTGFDELPGPGSLTPNSARVSQIMGEASSRMAQESTAALPFRSLDQMRRQAGAAAGNVTNKTDQQAGMTIIEGLDDFIENLSPDDVVVGDAKALKDAIPKARDLWARMSRSQQIDDAIAQEGNYLSGGASAIRNQFAKILRNPKLSRGFSEAEKAAMRRVVQGSAPKRILDLLGGGLGQLTQIGAGFGIGGLPGAALGAGTATLARKGSEAITNRNAEIARAIIAGGKMRGGLPVASEANRRVIEALIRRKAVAVPQ
ncbi:hypothetical protein OCH239_12610 [Roseivivax halodurans JCM 10272]|uniref:Uncharacterized protein n=1 Tax=Roseivivax halodurans JCM 10272 TaxID=1449350 RepID=X7EB09_9RHOB|nr:hypothetical protein [Roseivivax halodurans]ETX13274.1 hypothetical protein OCH239_12610 [Roseivivax halodurans JCM 10272]